MKVLGTLVCTQWATTKGKKTVQFVKHAQGSLFIWELLYGMPWKKKKYRPWLIAKE